MNGINWEEYEDCIGSSASCYSDVKKRMNYDTNLVITAARIVSSKIMKQTMLRWHFHTWQIMEQQSDTLKTFKDIIELMKTEAMVDKGKVISAQEKLLDCKNELLNNVKLAVESSIQSSVQQVIKLYSKAVSKSSESVMTHEALKEVVKCAIEDDDRSKNLIFFGIAEDEGEQLVGSIEPVGSNKAVRSNDLVCRTRFNDPVGSNEPFRFNNPAVYDKHFRSNKPFGSVEPFG